MLRERKVNEGGRGREIVVVVGEWGALEVRSHLRLLGQGAEALP